MSKKSFSLAAILAACLAGAEAQAAGIFEFNFGTGGDTVARGASSGGIDAGDGYGVAFGPHIPFSAADTFGVDLTLGYRHYDTTLRDAADVSQKATWTTIPINALLVYRTGFDAIFGAGLTLHNSPKLSYSGGTATDVTFDNAIGFVLQAGMVVDGGVAGIRYTAIDYEYGGGKVDGNQIAIYLGALF